MPVILPIEKKLKKRINKNIALAQDLLVVEMYNIFSDIVIHGGTCIWRCYKGNRFSEDIDVYLPVKFKESDELKKFVSNLEKRGFQLEKFKETENSIFSKFSYNGVIVRFEAVFKNIKNPITKSFEMSDGSFIIVQTLLPEEIIREKVSAYKKRRKIRDLYDIFFLLNFVEDKNQIKNSLIDLIKNFSEPVDPKDLKVLIILGAIPDIDEIMRVIKKWGK